jgi:hypothetical protein
MAETIIGILILLVFTLAGIYISIKLKNSNFASGKSKNANYSGNVSVSLKDQYMRVEMFKFYMAFSDALPAEFVIFPKIRVDRVLEPAGNFDAYKKIASKYIDFIIFKVDGLKPVCAIDLINPLVSTIDVVKQDEVVTKALEKVNVSVLTYTIEKEYDRKKMLSDFLETQDIYTIMEMKKNREK